MLFAPLRGPKNEMRSLDPTLTLSWRMRVRMNPGLGLLRESRTRTASLERSLLGPSARVDWVLKRSRSKPTWGNHFSDLDC
jgi:hypothetical protein